VDGLSPVWAPLVEHRDLPPEPRLKTKERGLLNHGSLLSSDYLPSPEVFTSAEEFHAPPILHTLVESMMVGGGSLFGRSLHRRPVDGEKVSL
jgi:hypothetical protein